MSRGRGVRRTAALAALLVAAPATAQVPPPESAPPARIAFVADGDVHTMNADGSDRHRLTTMGDDELRAGPVWSPNGDSIAFVRRGGGGESQEPRIWVMQADGSGPRPYGPAPPKRSYDSAPAWSPDGESIAFIRHHPGENSLSALMVSGPGGAGLRTLVRFEARSFAYLDAPDWSPDGKSIVYSRVKFTEASYEPSLYSVPAAGGTPRRLVANGDEASWSPDGQRIAFVSLRDKNGRRCGREECSYAGELYVMDADGTARTRLTNDLGDERAPAWSADGERIAFHSDRNYPSGEHPELYSIKPDGSCLTWLTNGTAESREPDWRPGPGATDPGGCGAVAREPLIETDTSAAGRAKFPVYWLGTATGDGLMLSGLYAYGVEAVVDYSDCSRFDPADCPPSVSVSSDWSCGRHVLFGAGYQTERVTRVGGGGLLYTRTFEDEADPELYAGPTTIGIYAYDRPLEPIVAALRQLGADAQPGQFPRAELPVSFLRRIERAAAARRKYGTARAARVLKTSRGVVKERSAIHRRLTELGGAGRLACPR